MTGKPARKGRAAQSRTSSSGSTGSTGTRKRRRRRPRPGARRRQALLAGCASTVVFSLILAVDRTADGRSLAESITELRREQEVLRIRQSEEFVRVDSLSSRERILVAAARFGLRPARDDEVVHIPDVGP